MRETKLDQIVYKYTKTLQEAFTVNATTDICTSSAHGLEDGDKVQLTTQTTIPGGLSLLTSYYVINATTDTFQLSLTPMGPAVDITNTGTGTHTWHLKGKAVYVGDYKYIAISLNFLTSPAMTAKFQASAQDVDNCPDFASAQSPTNRWDYIMVMDLNQETGAGGETGIGGDTGVACSGSADNRLFRINTSGISWLCVEISGWSAGVVDARISAYQ